MKSLKCKHFTHESLTFQVTCLGEILTDGHQGEVLSTKYWKSPRDFLKKTVDARNEDKVNTAFVSHGP